ncbi:MAG TPA: class I SAM-dependent methyltransferase [Tepidisphaeraceae bacterium]|jgi:2-polyprenyl-6-hydroxyphenyl methylase/3-demethylubiquinone-9 3-methyltransferase|nr:class I SAM-dependent methyltransferase [Tepidisphaeraceae bacterium]
MSDQNFRSVTEQTAVCKCCGDVARIYGVVDFNKNCEVIHNRQVLGMSGVPVYYHRCPRCGFIFTTFTDAWSKEDFGKNIYNAEYGLVDPEYADKRPRNVAGMITQLWGGNKDLRVLDYGGGNGLTGRLLREAGFKHVEVYDPFTPKYSVKPTGKFDLILMFEVLEHSPTPKQTVSDLASMLEDVGLVTLSTLLQPQDINAQGLNWWYVAPRNGHVSMHSRQSLTELAKPFGLMVGSFNDGLHLLVRGRPEFAKHVLKFS